MKTLLLAGILLLTTSCVAGRQSSRSRIFESGTSPLALRSMQSRVFDTGDHTQTLRAVIATLQDLNFLVEDLENALGTVSAVKLGNYQLQISVTVRPHGENQTLVRVNGQHGRRPLVDAEAYQQFFAALEKAMFLSAHEVD